MVSFLNLSQRKLKKLQKVFSVFSIFSLIFQISSGIFLYQPIFAQGATPTPTPTVTIEPTPIPTETPVITSSPEPEITPEISPTPDITPTPEITVEPSATPELTNSPEPTEVVPQPETVSPNNQPQAPPQETASSTPQVQGVQTENGHLAAVILEETKAASIDKLDLDFQTEGSAKIVTDKLDYAPTDTVLITGTGFTPNKDYTLIITSQDQPPVNFETKLTADDKGNLFYSYQLDGTYRPNYKAEIKDGDRVVASTTFTDSTGFFSDGFESGNFVNWTSVDSPHWAITNDKHTGSKGATIKGDTGDNDDLLLKNQSTVGYQNISLSFWYKIKHDLESGDHVRVEYSTDGGSNWVQLADYSDLDSGDWTQALFPLPSSINDNINFEFRFRAHLNSDNDEYRLDDVNLSGDALSPSPSPSPSPSLSPTPTPEEGKIDWCHCEPNGNCQTLNLPPTALQNAGHMDANGNPLHAGDYPGQCLAPTATPTLTPTPTPSPSPSPTPTPTPTPTSTPAPVCGDGSINQESEQCDGIQGVTEGQNFCTNNCKLIPIYDGEHQCPQGTVKSQNSTYSTSVSSTDPNGQTISLASGKTYLFEASGDYGYGGVPNNNQLHRADAGYATGEDATSPWGTIRHDIGIWPEATYRGVTSLLSDMGTGTMGLVDWGSYNSDHVYQKVYAASGNVNFRISDWYDEWYIGGVNNNQGGMRDNSGSLTLKVYECAAPKGTIEIKKVILPADTSTFWNFGIDAGYTLWDTGKTDGYSSGPIEVTPGNHSVVEQTAPGTDGTKYSSTFVCKDGDTVVATGGPASLVYGQNLVSTDFSVVADQHIICTFTNTKKGTIEIKKIISPSDTTNWNFGIDGGYTLWDTGKTDGYTSGQVGVVPGNHSVVEQVGYNGEPINGFTDGTKYTSTLVCKDGETIVAIGGPASIPYGVNLASTEFNVASDQHIVCTFTNKRLTQISGMKFDDANGDGVKGEGESGLSDWTIFAGQKVWENDVQALNTPEITSPILGNGTTYAIRVANTYNAGDGITADAKYSKRTPNTGWTDYVQHYEGYGPSLLDLQIDGASPDWGSYNASHVYWHLLTGSGAALKFKISDFYPSNDSGALHVEIYKVIAQTSTDGSGNYSFSLPDLSGDVIVGEVTQNSYAQTYPMPNGYWTIPQGENATDKDFGNQERGTLIIQKNAVGGDDTFNYTATGGNTVPSSFSITTSGDTANRTFNDVAAGNYSVSEEPLEGWDLTQSNCDNGDDLTSININPGSTVTCTFNNSKRGKVIVTKYQDNNADGSKDDNDSVLGGWDINLTGGDYSESQPTATGSGQTTFDNLVPGDYTLSENLENQGGWILSNISCSGDESEGETDNSNEHYVYVAAGDTVYCEIGNYQKGHISVTKNVVGPNGEDINDTSINFTFNLTDQNPFDLTDGQTSQSFDADPSISYSLSEQTNDNYEFSGCEINGEPFETINVTSGQSVSVVCTNKQKPGTITGTKWNDQNGDSQRSDDPGLLDWHIKLFKDNDGSLGDQVGSYESTNQSGNYSFGLVKPGSYWLCEDLQDDWKQTFPQVGEGTKFHEGKGICYQITLGSNGLVEEKDFGNFKLGEITACKYDDYNSNGEKDKNEPGIAGVTMTLEKRVWVEDNRGFDRSGDWEWQTQISKDTLENGCHTFTGLTQGDYRVSEDLNDLPGYSPISPESGVSKTVLINSGAKESLDFFNHLLPITLTLSKINNTLGSITPGGTITYTLTVTNTSKIIARDVSLRDTLPLGFSYVAGSTTGASQPTVTGQNLVWSLGDLDPDAIVTITYQAKTDSSLQEGKYPNVALTWGYNRPLKIGGETLDRTTTYTDPAWSWVNLVPGVSLSAGIGGTIQQVLGASTETGKVLGAATGAETGWLILAVLLILLGLVLKNFNKLKKLIKIFVLITPLLFGLSFAKSAQAANLSVQITTLPEYKNTPVFKLSYTALQRNGDPIQAQFSYRKEAGSYQVFGSLLNGETGSIEITTAIINEQGKYYFKVVATSGGESAESETSTTVDWSNPQAPTNYRKDRAGTNAFKIFWKNPDSSDFYKVFIYRSDKRDFTADSGTKIGERGGAPNEDMNYLDDSLPWSGETYYALRALDKAGNASDLVGDGGSTTYVEVSPSPGTKAVGEIQPLPVAGGGTEGKVLGEGTESSPAASTEPQAGAQPAGTSTGATNGLGGGSKLIWFLAGLGLLALAFYFFSRRSS